MENINQLVVEQLGLEKIVLEKAYRMKMVKRSMQTSRNMAAAGKMRQLARGTANAKMITLQRARLKKLLDRQRQMYSARARAAALRG